MEQFQKNLLGLASRQIFTKSKKIYYFKLSEYTVTTLFVAYSTYLI